MKPESIDKKQVHPNFGLVNKSVRPPCSIYQLQTNEVLKL